MKTAQFCQRKSGTMAPCRPAFFPGAKFGENEAETPDNPVLSVTCARDADGTATARAVLAYRNKTACAEERVSPDENFPVDRVVLQ